MQYSSTLADSTLIILFVQMLEILNNFFFFFPPKNKILWRKLKNLLEYSLFGMKSSKLIN
jgi:hypothetical protein